VGFVGECAFEVVVVGGIANGGKGKVVIELVCVRGDVDGVVELICTAGVTEECVVGVVCAVGVTEVVDVFVTDKFCITGDGELVVDLDCVTGVISVSEDVVVEVLVCVEDVVVDLDRGEIYVVDSFVGVTGGLVVVD
jgi:hypothetical protein